MNRTWARAPDLSLDDEWGQNLVMSIYDKGMYLTSNSPERRFIR